MLPCVRPVLSDIMHHRARAEHAGGPAVDPPAVAGHGAGGLVASLLAQPLKPHAIDAAR